jgi:hypothetical protein
MRINGCLTFCVFCLGTGILAGSSSQLAADSGVQISQLDGKLRVEINGQLFTEYHF